MSKKKKIIISVIAAVLIIAVIVSAVVIAMTKGKNAAKASGVYANKVADVDRKSTRLNSSHNRESRMPSSA